jgi:hypothetical protein
MGKNQNTWSHRTKIIYIDIIHISEVKNMICSQFTKMIKKATHLFVFEKKKSVHLICILSCSLHKARIKICMSMYPCFYVMNASEFSWKLQCFDANTKVSIRFPLRFVSICYIIRIQMRWTLFFFSNTNKWVAFFIILVNWEFYMLILISSIRTTVTLTRLH